MFSGAALALVSTTILIASPPFFVANASVLLKNAVSVKAGPTMAWGVIGVLFGGLGIAGVGLTYISDSCSMGGGWDLITIAAVGLNALTVVFGAINISTALQASRHFSAIEKEKGPIQRKQSISRERKVCQPVYSTYTSLLTNAKHSKESINYLTDMEKKYTNCFQEKKGKELLQRKKALLQKWNSKPSQKAPTIPPLSKDSSKGSFGFKLLQTQF